MRFLRIVTLFLAIAFSYAFTFYGDVCAKDELPDWDEYQPEGDPQAALRFVSRGRLSASGLITVDRYEVLLRKAAATNDSATRELVILDEDGATIAAVSRIEKVRVPTGRYYQDYMGSYQFRWRQEYREELRYNWYQVPFKIGDSERLIDVARDQRPRTPVLGLVRNQTDNTTRFELAFPNLRPWGQNAVILNRTPITMQLPIGFVPSHIVPVSHFSELPRTRFGTYYFKVSAQGGSEKVLEITVENPTSADRAVAKGEWYEVPKTNDHCGTSLGG